jgi:hypothetical protein
MFSDEEEWEDGLTVQERIKERENRQAVDEAKATLQSW